MNKEQILGRLLMRSHINLDEFYLLTGKEKPNLEPLKKEKSPYISNITQKVCGETKLYDWLEKFKKDNPEYTLNVLEGATTLHNGQ